MFFLSNKISAARQIINIARFSSSAVGILGAPFSKGQPKRGVDKAPEELRKYGLIEQLRNLELDVKDFGDIQFDENNGPDLIDKLKFPVAVGSACQKVSNSVRKVLEENRRCITLGGDHSLGMGTVHGHSQVHKDLCLLWIDAHADINTPSTSYSGNFHGMPMSFLIEELQKYKIDVKGFEWLNPCIRKTNVAYIGLRDVDPLEKLILRQENILHFTMRDIDRLGIFEVTKKALQAINPSGDCSLHVSFDIDSIDKLLSPSTGTPVHGGLTIREALCLAEEISKLNNVSAIDIVEINPTVGSKADIENTLQIAIMVIKAFLGYSRTGNVPLNKNVIPV